MEPTYLLLNKLTSKYGERIAIIFSIHCIKLEKFRTINFTFILSHFCFVSNATTFFILSVSRFVFKKLHAICLFFQSDDLYANISFECL